MIVVESYEDAAGRVAVQLQAQHTLVSTAAAAHCTVLPRVDTAGRMQHTGTALAKACCVPAALPRLCRCVRLAMCAGLVQGFFTFTCCEFAALS